MSNEGRVMLRVTADSCGLHDTSAGACSCESNTVRFGQQTRYQHACRENFVLEAAKHGTVAVLTKRSRSEGNTVYAQGGIAAVLVQSAAVFLMASALLVEVVVSAPAAPASPLARVAVEHLEGLLTAQTPGWTHVLLTIVTAVLAWRTRLHVLVMIAAGGVLGALGWV